MRDEVVMGNVLRDEFVMKDHEFITIVPTVSKGWSLKLKFSAHFLEFAHRLARLKCNKGVLNNCDFDLNAFFDL